MHKFLTRIQLDYYSNRSMRKLRGEERSVFGKGRSEVGNWAGT